MMTCRIYDEMLSFKRQECLFTYELLGMTHIDMDDVFDWMRVELRGRDWLGIDIPDGAAAEGVMGRDPMDAFSFDAARRQNEQ